MGGEPKKDAQVWADQNDAEAVGAIGSGFMRRTVMSAGIIAYSQLIICIWYVNKERDGSFYDFYAEDLSGNMAALSMENSLVAGFSKAFIAPADVHPLAWQFIGVFFIVSAVLMKVVPGKPHNGPVTPMGFTPTYVANGVQCFFIHIALFIWGGHYGYYKHSIVYDECGHILNGLNYIALVLVVVLYVKGNVAPTSKDNGTSGNLVFDLYWGTELYPRVLGWDIKQFTNCRFGMVYWAIAVISCQYAAAEKHPEQQFTQWTTTVIQMIYITKFFWWETGYFNSIDIMQDRAGYYICWGCLCYLPTVYTSMTIYMVDHPVIQTPLSCAAVIFAGIFCVWANYDADAMRVNFRRANGKCKVWGAPAEYITATYTTADGENRTSLLLLSGWWGWSRHWHYVPELSAAFFWSCGSGFQHIMPFFYLIYLTILLIDRSVRDDVRCRGKYGPDWDKYCARVPYKILPGIF